MINDSKNISQNMINDSKDIQTKQSYLQEILQLVILVLLTILTLFLVREGHSQEPIRFPLGDDSYISYPMGENLIFEGQIAPNYTVLQWGNTHSVFSGNVSITPKVILKMYRVRSSPVKTPSYMPKVTLQTAWKGGAVNLFPYLMISHHSNGQGGDTFLEDDPNNGNPPHHGTLPNTESGSFATNFIQLGYFFSMPGYEHHFLGISYEHHPVHGWWFGIDPAIQGLYSRKRIHYGYKYLGDIWQVEMDYTDLLDKPRGTPRGIVSATAKLKSPVFKKAMWLFASYYQGQDYYNINFTNAIKQFKAGIAIQTTLAIDHDPY